VVIFCTIGWPHGRSNRLEACFYPPEQHGGPLQVVLVYGKPRKPGGAFGDTTLETLLAESGETLAKERHRLLTIALLARDTAEVVEHSRHIRLAPHLLESC
jgi:hypothetical protein